MLDLSLLSRKELRKLLYAFLLTLISLLVGTLGFMEIEKFRLSEAFYMSVITVSTVGFNEVEPLSDAGRIFTSFYILFNLGIFAYVISVITAYIFEGEFGKIYKRFKVDREVNKMREHVIVCGFGRNGMKACEELHRSKRQFVIIDRDAQLIEQQSAHYPFHFMLGEATADETLKSAGIERASNLIITLPNDAENVFITLTAKELNKNVKVISRASDPNSLKKLYRAGADEVIMPDSLGGQHMAQIVTKPFVIEFLNLLNGFGEQHIALEEITYDELKPEYRHQTLRDMDIRSKTGATILAFKNQRGEFLFNPSSQETFDPEEVMIIIGKDKELSVFKQRYCAARR